LVDDWADGFVIEAAAGEEADEAAAGDLGVELAEGGELSGDEALRDGLGVGFVEDFLDGLAGDCGGDAGAGEVGEGATGAVELADGGEAGVGGGEFFVVEIVQAGEVVEDGFDHRLIGEFAGELGAELGAAVGAALDEAQGLVETGLAGFADAEVAEVVVGQGFVDVQAIAGDDGDIALEGELVVDVDVAAVGGFGGGGDLGDCWHRSGLLYSRDRPDAPCNACHGRGLYLVEL
jgi:hypothetical protein